MSLSPIYSRRCSASLKRFFHGLLSVCALLPSLAISREDPSRIWIGRPWEYRYVLFVNSPSEFNSWKRLGKKWLDEDIAKANFENAQRIETIFSQTTTIQIDPEHYREENRAIATVLIVFNRQGEVTSPYDWPHRLSGHIDRIWRVVLAPGNAPQDMQFRLGDWYTGEYVFMPAICSQEDMNERYRKGFSATDISIDGNFGCREWSHYLHSEGMPYIDITSYAKDKSTYIRPVIGWGRFDVPPKPVIGKHGNVWVCLHECPNGEAPGIIPDIKAWAAKNGWPVPKRPKKMPLFPDKPRKPGTFID